MNMPVAATTLPWLLRREAGAAQSAGPRRTGEPEPAADWGAETRPLIFRSEAFAEDLDDLVAA